MAEELGIEIGEDDWMDALHATKNYPHDYALFCVVDRLTKQVGCDVVVKAEERMAVAAAVRRMGVEYEK